MKYFAIIICLFFGLSHATTQTIKSLSMEEIKSEIIQARESRDYCSLANLYLERASRNKIRGADTDYILDDLKLSESCFRVCIDPTGLNMKDSTGFYLTKLEYAEVLYINGIKKDFAISEAEDALAYFSRNGIKSEMIHTHHVLAQLHEQKFELDEAQDYIKMASETSEEINDSMAMIKSRMLGSRLTTLAGRPEISLLSNIKDFELGCDIFNLEDEDPSDDLFLADLGLTIVQNFLTIEQPAAAIDYINYIESLGIADNRQMASLYDKAIQAYREIGNYNKALNYSDKYIPIINQIRDSEKEASIEISIEKQENEVLQAELYDQKGKNVQLQNKATYSTLWNVYLGFAIIASLIAIYYITRFYNQKIAVNELISDQREEIDKQRIVKLENNMKIQSLSSMVAGQEAERNRIANDLHDSLGGTLSALKLQFENVVMDKNLEDDTPFDHISKLIDGACSEVREIARNLKPASLENMGLEAAIRDLINKYNSSSNIEFTFNTYVNELNLKHETKLNLYRIIQELLNNVVKHADASEVDVQLTLAAEELIIKVEDDGKGFNLNWVKKGLGLDSMQSRVNVLKGDMNIDTAPGRGTSVIIHIPIEINSTVQQTV